MKSEEEKRADQVALRQQYEEQLLEKEESVRAQGIEAQFGVWQDQVEVEEEDEKKMQKKRRRSKRKVSLNCKRLTLMVVPASSEEVKG